MRVGETRNSLNACYIFITSWTVLATGYKTMVINGSDLHRRQKKNVIYKTMVLLSGGNPDYTTMV